MAVPMPMLLPKGIVVNSDDVYAEVASYSVVPPEKIWEYWHVYTTTFRKLIDPTAHRLENFWWHVWGSDRRNLSGRALARIFEDISKGPTIIPLRGPPNRYEGPPAPRFSQHESDRSHPSQSSRSEQYLSNRPPESLKEHTPSSSRPPPLHPILKKPRGPSTSGPRPTARFVSPPGSDDEGLSPGEEPSSTSTANTGIDMRPSPNSASPAKLEKRATPTKKFVASTTTSKRRPVLPRRPSSQSSTGSDPGSREGPSSGSRYVGSQPSIPTIAEHTARTHVPRSQGSSASPLQVEQQSTLSAKAAGKRPAAKPLTEKRLTPRNHSHNSESQERPLVIQPSPTRQPASRNPDVDNVTSNTHIRETHRTLIGNIQNTLAPEPSLGPTDDNAAPPMARSSSNIESHRSRELTPGRPPPRGLVASSVAATSDVAVRGTFDFENPDPTSILGSTMPDEPGLSSLVSRPSTASLLEARFTPTQPSPTPVVPLGRSKSQLTLLLEREKARVGDPRSHKDKKKGEDKDKK